jgi:hypothetical protein
MGTAMLLYFLGFSKLKKTYGLVVILSGYLAKKVLESHPQNW